MKRRRGGGRGKGGGGKKDIDVEDVTVTPTTEKATKASTKTKTKAAPKPEPLKLSKKPGKLTKQDVTCPICWSMLMEPTTLPCNHSLCTACFKKHIEETSLCCPCCRLRLSLWARKTMKENKLLDEELWTRIQNEFPKLVEIRLLGGDSQDVMEDELPLLSPNFNYPSLLESSCTSVRDGTMCEGPGEIREEFEQMMEQHQRDVETERLRAESASADAIKKLEEEENMRKTRQRFNEEQDYQMALKIQEELRAEEEKAKLASRNSSSTSTTPRRNLMEEWVASNSNSSSNQLIKTVGKSVTTPRGSKSGRRPIKRSSTGKKTPTSSKKTPTSTLEYTKASQDVMFKFLSSQSQLTPVTSSVLNSSASLSSFLDDSPCCSKSIPNHDISFSAFSLAKTSRNPTQDSSSTTSIITPVDHPPVSIESWNVGVKVVIDDTSSKTPDSIKSEVDRHFRPIRSAPKTPPRRRADGTFLPEPKLVRTTPIRPSKSTSSYSGSPVKQTSDNGKPSCATAEKRISNDSGRGSDDTDDSRSPDGEQVSSPFYILTKGSDPIVPSNFNTQSNGNERGCTSEDYRVTPESDDVPVVTDRQKKRLSSDEINGASPCKRAKVTETTVFCTPKKSTSGSSDKPIVKEEPLSPSILSEWISVSPDSSPIAAVVKVEKNQKYFEAEAEALELYQKKIEQEAADRKFAEMLQKSYNRGITSPRGKNSRRKYSLRNWLEPKIKQEVKIEKSND